jgi:hypothetical protein
MDISVMIGSMCFGIVIGWITYYTMRKNTKPRELADITVILSALVGPAILAVFPAPEEGKSTMFGWYGIGLAIGFFLYLVFFIILISRGSLKLLRRMGLAPPRAAQAEGGEGQAGAPAAEGQYATGAMSDDEPDF